MFDTKRRVIVGSGCAIAALACGVLQFARCSKSSISVENHNRNGKPASIKQGDVQARPEDKTVGGSEETLGANAPKHWKEFRKSVPIEALKGFLEAHGHDAKSSAIAYDLSQDEDFLMQAWARHKGERFIAARVALAGPEHVRLEAAQDMVAKNPKDALGYYLLAKNSPAGTASTILNKIADSAITDYRAPDTYSYLRDAYRHLGYEDADARLAACFGSTTDLYIASAQVNVISDAYAEKPDEDQLFAATAAVEHLANQSQWSSTSYLAALSLKNDFLKEMDPDTPFGDNGDTVQSQLLRVEQERARMQKVIKFDPDTLTEAERDVFIDRAIKTGQIFAVQKLLEEREHK